MKRTVSRHSTQRQLLFVFFLLLNFHFSLLSVCSIHAQAVPALHWNTFIGGTSDDQGYAITVDEGGNVYVAGLSFAAWGSPVRAYAGSLEGFVTKLDKNGKRLWHTFLGSAEWDWAYGIALDKAGNIYVTGESGATWGDPVIAFAGVRDAFVAKLDNSGELVWNTFLGGTDLDIGIGVALDSAGNVHVAGYSSATWGFPENDFTGDQLDAFVAKLNNNGELLWNSFLGGTASDDAEAVAVDMIGNVYVTGESNAAWGSPINPYTEDYDVFVAKLDGSGTLQWNTFLGGTGYDVGLGLALDLNSNLFVTGNSRVPWGTPINPFTAGQDIFIAKLSNSGVLQWHTFLGGDDIDYCRGVAVDNSGGVYVGGYSYTNWGDPVIAFAGERDAFVAKLDNFGSLQWHTFLGGVDEDYGRAISINGEKNVYIAGSSQTSWGSPVTAHSEGASDAFVAMLWTDTFPWPMFLPAITNNSQP